MINFLDYVQLKQENYNLINYHPDDHAEIREILNKIDKMYALAGPTVSGLKVREDIPNTSSI